MRLLSSTMYKERTPEETFGFKRATHLLHDTPEQLHHQPQQSPPFLFPPPSPLSLSPRISLHLLPPPPRIRKTPLPPNDRRGFQRRLRRLRLPLHFVVRHIRALAATACGTLHLSLLLLTAARLHETVQAGEMRGVQALGTDLLHAVDLAVADAASCFLACFGCGDGVDAGVFGVCSCCCCWSCGIDGVGSGDFVEFGRFDFHS